LREIDARCPVIFITGKSTTDTAIEAMKLGAFEYLLKPLELPQLRQVIDLALTVSRMTHVPAVVAEVEPVDDRADAIIGRCPAMQEVYKAIGRVAGQDVPVLLTGESGTGKELVARALYQHSGRSAGPFRALNCAAIPEQLLETELFGHERGAFTGADRQRIGKFEQCAGGTLFLDEVSTLSPLAQSKMLRLIQEKTFERLGGNETIHADVRLLAASNKDLAELVQDGRFRQDLFYRLSVFTIHLPPLRDRGDDMNLLVHHYLRRFNRELNRNVNGISPEALEVLKGHAWPGNVRELQNVLKQGLLQAAGEVLLPDFLPRAIFEMENRGFPSARKPEDSLEAYIEEKLRLPEEGLYQDCLRRMEKTLLTKVLEHTGGNQVQAASILGITRGSLRNKIRDLGITIARTVATNEESAE
jgi:two-component system nitrogen regulation response regulator GlnG